MTDVLISGAGVAGTALAWWLRHHGFRPTVVERAPALRDGGYKVDVRGAALTVLDRMGLREQVSRRDTGMRLARFVAADGRQLATMDAALFGGREGDDVEIMRGDLVRILMAATGDVDHRFADSITALRPAADGVEVDFASGTSRRFDLVIGADGLHSTVRRLAFGPASAYLRPLGHHIAICTVPAGLGEERVELMHPAPGRTVGVYRTAGAPDARALFLFPSPADAPDHRDVAGQRAALARAFAGAGWRVPELLAALPDAPDLYLDAMSQVRMDRWSTGRIALVGDAGYAASPASGQGTSLGLVGAYVLAAALAEAAGDPVAGFAAYERRMRPFVAANQQLAERNLKGMVLGSAAQIRFQTLMLRLMPRLPGRERMIRRVTEPIRTAAAAITLPDVPARAA
ncbi:MULTISPECIES: FAD-dependent monooxygenase [Micromonospora]|uniref:FAD-dependent oxidoreductase n=1 Tax=Micromonospora solifontis TaxID=2487138 RepID=A0ABX9WGX6_9ACTN|nr:MULTISPECIES: FAD-dependent monooxygenase [Micromonospora]NES13873.1 FAD-dependent oxidoreductase [Micromonospora sp. PPF5-17B]NES37942.1 FAD-dependent oxidoreductase [Micromonospora solifontis]NES53973.1 FAD-dependent oxidoreductase [Micromonospora sp. PPF5-6]RNL97791.1 FAD-dependent oxidoreductase [Micromonospora solifontis]